jgi:hypothetical protein
MPKQALLNGIKSFRCYTFEEAAEITGVSARTIRNWASNGLRLLDRSRPILIRGDDLRDYIKDQRESRKVMCGPDEFFCCRCRRARKAAGGFADCLIVGKRVTLTALCETCETVVTKPIAEARIPEIARTLDLTIKRPAETL